MAIPTRRETSLIDNELYHSLGARWYEAQDDPVALLRAEGRVKSRWIAEQLRAIFPDTSCAVLDMGCGGGFLANALAAAGHRVTGIDLSESSLEVARQHDPTRSVKYLQADASKVPFAAQSFDAVCAMDFLEHVEDPEKIVREASRVLRPGGLFFFHTFNRTPLSWLVVIQGVKWCVKGSPPNLHAYSFFIKPSELREICRWHELRVDRLVGIQPRFFTWPFWKMLLIRKVPHELEFEISSRHPFSYLGFAHKVA